MKFRTLGHLMACFIKCKVLGRRYPLAIAFELTHRCNLNCPHCYAQDEVAELGKGEHFRILEEIHQAGCKVVSFTGGEPLLIPYVPELIEKAKGYGMWVQYTTNGVLLPECEDALKRTPADMVQVSLDGDIYSHDKARGKGAFDKVIRALEVVRRNRWRCLIVCVLNKHTTKESIAFAMLKALETGAFISFQPLCDLPALGPSRAHLMELLDFLKEMRRVRGQRQFEDVLVKHKAGKILRTVSVDEKHFYNPMNQSMSLIKQLYNFPDFGSLPCVAGKLFGRIRPDGQLVPCYYAIDKDRPMNILKDGFARCWQHLNLPECVNCWHHHRLELNLIYNLSMPTLMNVLYYHLSDRFRRKG